MNKNKDIPKIIHQIWLQGEENISESNKIRIKNIKQMHPDWNYILFFKWVHSLLLYSIYFFTLYLPFFCK